MSFTNKYFSKKKYLVWCDVIYLHYTMGRRPIVYRGVWGIAPILLDINSPKKFTCERGLGGRAPNKIRAVGPYK